MTNRERVYEATRSYLEEHPEVTSAFERMLVVDEAGPWDFDDTPLDSGRFGTIVSEGIVEKTDAGEYRLADREAIASALRGEDLSEPDAATTQQRSVEWPAVDWTIVAGLLVALAIIVIARASVYRSVMRDGRVVSIANDPYFYRYMQRQLLEISSSPIAMAPVTEIPGRASSRPLTHVVNWWVSALLGGTPAAADLVAAWLPVIGTVALGVVLFGLVRTVTGDARIGIASVLVLAVIPVHALYTSLGFLEHRVHQYFWLGVLLFALVWLAVDLHRQSHRHGAATGAMEHCRRPLSWGVAGVLAVAVAASAHAWAGSALTFLPVAAYVALRVIVDVRADLRPGVANLPLLAGLAGGGVLAYLPHTLWGWHQSDPALVITPVALAVGAVAIVAVGEVWHWRSLSGRSLLVATVVVGIASIVGLRYLRPEEFARLQHRLTDSLLGRGGVREGVSLYSLDLGLVFGPGLQIGVFFFIGMPVVLWLTWSVYRRYEPGYLALVVFAWYYAVLAGIQLRFAAQFSVVLAVFAGIIVVGALSWLGIIASPQVFRVQERDDGLDIPERVRRGGDVSLAARQRSDGDDDSDRPMGRRRFAYLLLTVLLLFGFNLVYLPMHLGATVYGEEVDGVAAIEDHVAATDRAFPENYVLSRWGSSRMFNFFVNGEASHYRYAMNNYIEFITASDIDDMYHDHAHSVGYVIVEARSAPVDTVQYQLFDDLGADSAHYQLLYSGEDIKAFALVEGAVVTVSTAPNAAVELSTTVTVDDTTIEYTRSGTADDDGEATIRVAYPGEYEIGDQTVEITLDEIEAGAEISVEMETDA